MTPCSRSRCHLTNNWEGTFSRGFNTPLMVRFKATNRELQRDTHSLRFLLSHLSEYERHWQQFLSNLSRTVRKSIFRLWQTLLYRLLANCSRIFHLHGQFKDMSTFSSKIPNHRLIGCYISSIAPNCLYSRIGTANMKPSILARYESIRNWQSLL